MQSKLVTTRERGMCGENVGMMASLHPHRLPFPEVTGDSQRDSAAVPQSHAPHVNDQGLCNLGNIIT
jgi:hypothetical protein